jgi:hypothetical protein
MLNAKLSEKADNLELAEEQIFDLWCEYMGTVWDGEVDYEDNFDIMDESEEYSKLQVAKSAATGPEVLAVIDQMLVELIVDDTNLEGIAVGPLGVSGSSDLAMPTTATTPVSQQINDTTISPGATRTVNEMPVEAPPMGQQASPSRSGITRTTIRM